MVSYKYNSFQVDMVNCYWISQFYHKPVRSCSFLAKKKVRFYAGLGVLQTPNIDERERREVQYIGRVSQIQQVPQFIFMDRKE